MPLFAGAQALTVATAGTVPATPYFAGWFTDTPNAADFGFQQISFYQQQGTVSVTIGPAGTAGGIWISDLSDATLVWSDTPVTPLLVVVKKSPAFAITAPGTQTETVFGVGVIVTVDVAAAGWGTLYAATYSAAGILKTSWTSFVVNAQSGYGVVSVLMNATGDYIAVVDDPTAPTQKSISAPVTIIPASNVTTPLVDLAVAHPEPLYGGQQTLTVAIAGVLPSNTVFSAAWSSTGAPLANSTAFAPISFNANGTTGSVTLFISNAGTRGGLYLTDGDKILLQWTDIPYVPAASLGTVTSSVVYGSLLGVSSISPLSFEVYAQANSLYLMGTKTYGKVASLSLAIDGVPSGVIQPSLVDGPWSYSLPMLPDGVHILSVYVAGDTANIATATIILPIGGAATSGSTPLDAYIAYKKAVYSALAAFKASLQSST